MSDPVEQFLDQCSACDQCSTVCPFLEKHGEPSDIIANRPQLSFLCTNCTGCDRRCPLDLSPSRALFATKERLIREGRVPVKAAEALKGARSFAERGHRSPFVRYDGTRTAFWPGCSLAGTSPEAVTLTRGILSEALGEDIGLILDCCFDPLFQMGDTVPVREAVSRIRDRVRGYRIERIIVGCANCRKVFDLYPIGVRVEYVLEVLPQDLLKKVPENDLYLHYPCPFYHVDGIRERARAILANAVEEVDDQRIPACCGLGGSLGSQDPELAARFAERVTMEAYGASIVTACMGCVNTFLKRDRETYHILDLITGAKPRARAVSSAKKWANRLMLAKGKI
ncbi:MAG: (Fe-S)-binding protein [bacterium]|nr:MAG: (Fe-S)-binding protein [bacterium]